MTKIFKNSLDFETKNLFYPVLERKGYMKRRFLTILFFAILSFCSLNVLAAISDPCNTEEPPPPDPNPGDCMSIELGE